MSGETTLDSICRGSLRLEQPREGYRFNLDPVILADFAATRATPPARIVDLGAGVGILGLLLALRFPSTRVLLVELQPELAELAEANARRNGLGDRVEVRCLDLRESARWSAPGRTLVVSNPPYFRAESGRPSPRAQISLAKHEIACRLDELLVALAHGLALADELALVYPHAREAELLEGLVGQGLPPLLLRRIHPLPGRPPSRILVLAGRERSQAAPVEEPALVVEEEPGRYSTELQRVLEPGQAS